jgi:Cu(I)/Ag(I) efflux system membrane fusion protein
MSMLSLPPRAALLAALVLTLPGCNRREPPAGDAMAGMPGMEGMSMPSDSGVPIDRAAAARLGITFARAARQPVRGGIRLAGTLGYAEPRRAYVNARVNGWVEQLQADYVGKPVREGDPLLALYSPELVSAQEEYLAARRLGDSALAAAAQRRLLLWDIPAGELEQLERSGAARRTLTLRAPRSGEIAEKMVIQGQAVRAGDNLFLIADRSTLWVDVAVFEIDAPAVRVGTRVTVTPGALSGRSYPGRVTFLQPSVDQRTRTLTARVEVANRDGALRPGMYATVAVAAAAQVTLTVPLTAVLPTGTRNVVFVNRGDGTFQPQEVEVGVRGDSLIEIRRGLKLGDEVVASATYLFDSESNLAAAMQGLMLQMGMGLNQGGMQMDTTKKVRRP